MNGGRYGFSLVVTSVLPTHLGRIPMSVDMDFGRMARQAGAPGVFDPNSIEVVDEVSGEPISFARTEDLAYGDRGRIEWVVEDPTHTAYEIRFRTLPKRPPLQPQEYTPMIGVGDLLRYNAGVPRPIAISHSMRLVDMTGDGRGDLVGCWNYYYRPGSPISGIVCYPRVGPEEDFTFGDLARLRYVDERGSGELKHFPDVYAEADFADLNGNGLTDIVYAGMLDKGVTAFLNSGERDGGGLPVFVKDIEIPAPVAQNAGIHIVDLSGNGAPDLVVNGHYIRNLNPEGWPFMAADAVDLEVGKQLAFVDLDDDGLPDVMSMPVGGYDHPLTWRRNLGGDPPGFGPQQKLGDVEPDFCSRLSAVTDGNSKGILVQHNMYQNLTFYELAGTRAGQPRFEHPGRARSVSAVMSLSDQSWPCSCDWNGDGVYDFVIGGGYGWPRVVINSGSNERPVWTEPELICSEGEPIRILRDEILHSKHWHNMGYPYPVFVDWDGDGLPDLMLPNETNRIVWYRNIGTFEEARFGTRRFLEVDGFPDSDDLRAETGRAASDETRPSSPYPFDARSPFFWRTGAAFADWNGDGMMDFIAHDHTRKATLFLQYRDGESRRRLKRGDHVRLVDGREIDDSIVGRTKHWTESFRAVDWDGDGLIDLVYNLAGTGKIYLLRNVGSVEAPVFDLPREFRCYGEEIAFTVHGPNAWPGDFNGDGKPDLLGCVEWSVYPFYCHAALEMESHPKYRIGTARKMTF